MAARDDEKIETETEQTPPPDGEGWFEAADAVPLEVPRRSLMRLGLVIFVFVMAVFLMARLSAGSVTLLFHGRTGDCGDVAKRAESPGGAAPLEHGDWCRLKGVVAYPWIVATGEENTAAHSLSERSRGQKFITQLEGDRIFVIIEADRVDVVNHRVEFRNLFGFHVNEDGRVIDPEQDERYTEVGRALREKADVPAGEAIRLFDTTDEPLGNWFVGLSLVLVAFIAIRAVFTAIGLVRDLRAARGVRREMAAISRD